jgi:hypothetical protein
VTQTRHHYQFNKCRLILLIRAANSALRDYRQQTSK